jgi:hypothetical protein
MGKIVKGIVLGAAVGAGIRLAQDLKTEDDLGAIAPRVAKTAGEAALAGAAVGTLLSMRDRRRRKKAIAAAKAAGGAAKLKMLTQTGVAAAVPVLQHAAEVARERAKDAADTARPVALHLAEEAMERAEHAFEVAKPHLEEAQKQAKKRAQKAGKEARKRAEVARPKVEAAAKEARKRADNVADLATEKAKRKLAELDLPVVVAV